MAVTAARPARRTPCLPEHEGPRAKSHMVRLKTPDFAAYEFGKDLPSLQQIAHAAKQSGGYLKRLVWWETCHSSTLCWRLLAKPLFSLRSVGSITNERMAKPLKNAVWIKGRPFFEDSTTFFESESFLPICRSFASWKAY